LTDSPGIPLRTDAHRNRQRLIEVARVAFASDSKPSLEAIARDASVGIGTLYRHFPTREALVEAVYQAELSRLCDQAGELLAQLTPDVALRTWMDRFADYVSAKREMADALRAVFGSGAITSSSTRERLSGAIRPILEAGAASGTFRPEVDSLDVVASIAGIFVTAASPDQAGRMLDLLMAGLRA
jgi:AcrR family transcriptional regulator